MARKNVDEPSVSDGKNAAPEPTEAGTIQVQPVRRFMDGDIFRTPADDPFMSLAYVLPSSKDNGLVTIVGEVPDNKMNRAPETKG